MCASAVQRSDAVADPGRGSRHSGAPRGGARRRDRPGPAVWRASYHLPDDPSTRPRGRVGSREVRPVAFGGPGHVGPVLARATVCGARSGGCELVACEPRNGPPVGVPGNRSRGLVRGTARPYAPLARKNSRGNGPSRMASSLLDVRTDLGPSGAPVYFDYEGAWSRAIGATSSISYPQSLPVAVDGTTRPSAGDLRAVLARPFTPSLGDRLTLRFSASHLSPRQRRLVEHGWVAHRQFPSLAKIPPFRGRQDERVVFTTGLLQTGWGLRQFLDRLYRDHRVAPFLAIEDSGRVLLAMLSPAPDRVPQSRPAVQLFQDALREIEYFREPIRTLDPVIDHRYDRLFFG